MGDVPNVEALLTYLSDRPHGILLEDIDDAYPGCLADVEKLIAKGDVYKLGNKDDSKSIIYPKDTKCTFEVDDAVRDLWRSVEIPNRDALIAKLRDAKLIT